VISPSSRTFHCNLPLPCPPLSALTSGRALKVTRCLQEVGLYAFTPCCSCTHVTSLQQLDEGDCVGVACASDGPRPSALTTLVLQGAANNLDNAVPPAYVSMMPKQRDAIAVDMEVAYEM